MGTGAYGKHQEFRNFEVQLAELATDVGTVTTTSEAGTLNDCMGIVTTNALDAAAGAEETIVLTNSKVSASDIVLATIIGGTSAGTPILLKAVPAAGSITFTLKNDHSSTSFNGTVIIAYVVIRALSGIV